MDSLSDDVLFSGGEFYEIESEYSAASDRGGDDGDAMSYPKRQADTAAGDGGNTSAQKPAKRTYHGEKITALAADRRKADREAIREQKGKQALLADRQAEASALEDALKDADARAEQLRTALEADCHGREVQILAELDAVRADKAELVQVSYPAPVRTGVCNQELREIGVPRKIGPVPLTSGAIDVGWRHEVTKWAHADAKDRISEGVKQRHIS